MLIKNQPNIDIVYLPFSDVGEKKACTIIQPLIYYYFLFQFQVIAERQQGKSRLGTVAVFVNK